MSRVVAVYRNRNQTVAYMVVRSGDDNRMTVVKYDPNDGLKLTEIRSWVFRVHDSGVYAWKSHSESEAYNEATSLAYRLSREPPEVRGVAV